LEMTERFEIGLNDRTSVASISGFFKRGVINANLNPAGTTITDNDSPGTFKSRLKTFLFSLGFN